MKLSTRQRTVLIEMLNGKPLVLGRVTGKTIPVLERHSLISWTPGGYSLTAQGTKVAEYQLKLLRSKRVKATKKSPEA